jgi:hypothetical protein
VGWPAKRRAAQWHCKAQTPSRDESCGGQKPSGGRTMVLLVTVFDRDFGEDLLILNNLHSKQAHFGAKFFDYLFF